MTTKSTVKSRVPKGAEPGTRYGSLVVVVVVVRHTTMRPRAVVLFDCDCGAQCEKKLQDVRRYTKIGGHTSCGCQTKALRSAAILERFDPTQYMLKRYGRLRVTGVSLQKKNDGLRSRLVCLCDCGAQKISTVSALVHGLTTSCGCYRRELAAERGKASLAHGHTVLGELAGVSPVYKSWVKVRLLCQVGHARGFHLVCHEYDPRWNDFQAFLDDFGSHKASQTVSRWDRHQPWSKANCFVNVGQRGTVRYTSRERGVNTLTHPARSELAG